MPSQAYQQALARVVAHHRGDGNYTGKFLRPHKPLLVDLAREHGIASALDYGCGKGAQYLWRDPADGLTIEDALGFHVGKYDPGVARFAAPPKARFDMVLCTHVLGSVPIADLPWFLTRLFSYATKLVFIAERLGPVKKNVLPQPDLHPIGWTHEQWEAVIVEHRPAAVRVVLMTRTKTAAGTVWARRDIA